MLNPDQHKLPSGIDPHTSAQTVLGDADLSGKTAIVTGGYSGIGLETTRALASAGARVIVPARTIDKAKTALAELNGDIEIATMNLADLINTQIDPPNAPSMMSGGKSLSVAGSANRKAGTAMYIAGKKLA